MDESFVVLYQMYVRLSILLRAIGLSFGFTVPYRTVPNRPGLII